MHQLYVSNGYDGRGFSKLLIHGILSRCFGKALTPTVPSREPVEGGLIYGNWGLAYTLFIFMSIRMTSFLSLYAITRMHSPGIHCLCFCSYSQLVAAPYLGCWTS